MNINIICLKWGTKYGPEYVNNLFAAIQRHTSIPVKLHCFTEDSTGITTKNVKIHPLPFDNLEGWWNKLYLFSKDLPIPLGSRVVFFDLDTLVTDNIDDILSISAKQMVALRDFYTGIAQTVQGNNNMGSGLMAWEHGLYTHIWDRFIKDPQGIIKSIHPHGDQRWIQLNTSDRLYWQDVFPNKVVSFKVHCRDGLPPKAAIVCYHGKPSIPESIVNHTKSWKWTLTPQPWVRDHWPTETPTSSNTEPPTKKINPLLGKIINKPVKTYFALIDANKIFGMVGRCGGGYNTVWEDWSDAGRAARDNIIKEFEEGINNICGHYTKLENSILNEGFRNPLIITLGNPVRKPIKNLPPEWREKPNSEKFILEGTTGGSRLYVAQKYNLKIPCFVNDYTGTFNGSYEIHALDQALLHFKDKPRDLKLDPKLGIVESFDPHKVGYHLGVEWSEDKIIRQRAPMWVSIMNKYGYYVDRVKGDVLKYLHEAGVSQPDELKKRFNSRGT